MPVTVPEYITVHLGPPGSPAQNIRVLFADYIKNVASSEIYPTWPENAIRANILAQITFALNRVYTEFYRSRGYDYDITNSTAYDQSFVPGRDVFENISQITDDIFNDYIVRQGQIQPLFATYCDGREVQCEGLSQWGSVELADSGRTPYEILQNYYGNDINIIFNAPVGTIAESYPGIPLRLGSFGDDIRQLQYRLNRVAQNYPSITLIPEINGVFGVQTESAVRDFQSVFNLSIDGIVGKSTWYKIVNISNGVKRLSELNSEGLTEEEVSRPFFGSDLRIGDTGGGVGRVQYLLNALGMFDPALPLVDTDLIFGQKTENAVRSFQQQYGLPVTGIVNRDTWNALLGAYDALLDSAPSDNELYPGLFLSRGMESEEVRDLQNLIIRAAERNPTIPTVTADGVFGAQTERAVKAIQSLYGLEQNGTVGPLTWEATVAEAG